MIIVGSALDVGRLRVPSGPFTPAGSVVGRSGWQAVAPWLSKATCSSLIERLLVLRPFRLADPPWQFATWSESGKSRSPDCHYGTNAVDEIMKLPVAALAADHCALLLWCTGPHIAIGSHVKVIKAWGFRPSTIAFDWIKQNPRGDGFHLGMGYWSRSNSEQCFIAIKGSPRRLATDVHQVNSRRSNHHRSGAGTASFPVRNGRTSVRGRRGRIRSPVGNRTLYRP